MWLFPVTFFLVIFPLWLFIHDFLSCDFFSCDFSSMTFFPTCLSKIIQKIKNIELIYFLYYEPIMIHNRRHIISNGREQSFRRNKTCNFPKYVTAVTVFTVTCWKVTSLTNHISLSFSLILYSIQEVEMS